LPVSGCDTNASVSVTSNLFWARAPSLPEFIRNQDFTMVAHIPGRSGCCWTAIAPKTSYPGLTKSHRTDVAVIGAGIVGLTAAYKLCKAGASVTVIEALRVGRQVTGRSSAKITSQHSLIYRHLRDSFDLETARVYADANRAGAAQTRTWIHDLDIACDLEEKDAYAYTCDDSLVANIEAEASVARELGFGAEVVSPAPLPFQTFGALRFPREAQFNPAQYLVGLAAAVKCAGGSIFENTRVHDVKAGRRWRVIAERGRIEAENVVIATNLPIAGPGHYDLKTRPRGHIAMAFRVDSPTVVEGMFIGIDSPTHSIRTGRDDEGLLLIVLGPAFITGQEGDVAARFCQLDEWARKNLPVQQAVWRWFNEDYDTPDRVPYIGEPEKKSKGFYIATGFNGWGISNGAAAGLLISDLILGRSNPWVGIYDPQRRAPKKYNQGDDTHSLVDSIDNIQRGQGAVIKRGKAKLAVYRAANGSLRALSASCTHAGCIVTWNNADLTWDCPCHGSIFSTTGQPIHGPATKPLPPRKLAKTKTKSKTKRANRH
jgi:glycine/D-amino acid oxidase-like deaminating enzyme/nitrite reductase/ring-hydroxylating ferredoxin subunit